jgi:OmpA-OmpF porin, OOP family
MKVVPKRIGRTALLALLAVTTSHSVSASAQEQGATDPIIVDGATPVETPVAPAEMVKGPEIKGIISARNGDRLKITKADGSSAIVAVNDATRVRTGGLFGGRSMLPANGLLNGLPVTIKTMQAGDSLVASQISFRSRDMKTASMIRNGTSQQFDEQTAATEALRGRMGDIDQYNIKDTMNVYFDTGKAALSEQAKQQLCSAATTAEGVDNALMLVVGYTDAVGDEDYNQKLSEKRASSVINYLQQACRWKPYRMLTPTGMAESDPVASNDTDEGKAQNRRVSVNVLVSKAVDGL